jgi:hypothetical protein
LKCPRLSISSTKRKFPSEFLPVKGDSKLQIMNKSRKLSGRLRSLSMSRSAAKKSKRSSRKCSVLFGNRFLEISFKK